MPYLTREKREAVHKQGFAWDGAELNYLICYHANKMLKNRAVTAPLRYADFAEVLAAIEGAKFEFLRGPMAAYEDRKLNENGTIWSPGYQLPG